MTHTLSKALNGSERGRVLRQTVTIIQSMRADRFGDVTVLGSQYRDQNRMLHWCFAMWSEQDTRVRIRHVSGGEIPSYLDSDDRQALIEAIRVWESSPRSHPN